MNSKLGALRSQTGGLWLDPSSEDGSALHPLHSYQPHHADDLISLAADLGSHLSGWPGSQDDVGGSQQKPLEASIKTSWFNNPLLRPKKEENLLKLAVGPS